MSGDSVHRRNRNSNGIEFIADAPSSIEADLSHRRMFGAETGLAPFPDSAVFDHIGGRAAVNRMVDSLYDRFEADGVIRPFFGRDLSNTRERQKLFFAEWLGGLPGYSESAWGTLYGHHEDLPITRAVAERWLGHLRGALSDTVSDEVEAALILERAQTVARALVNHEGSAPSADPAPSTSKHRSARIASCGVGARVLKRAVLSAQRGKVDELAALVVEIPEVIERPAFAAELLHSATLSGRVQVVEWLLDRGVDVNRPAPLPVGVIGASFELVFFVTPLCAARMKRRSEVSKYLLGRGAREDIFTAAFLGDLQLVRRLLAERPSLAQASDPATDVLTITPIHHAVAGDQLPTLRVLLDHTTDPVRTGGRALRAAAARRNRPMVELLLEHGTDARAVGAGRWVLDPEIAPLLASSGASAGVGISGEESGDWIRISCTGNRGRNDDPTYVAALLRYGARIDQRYNGATPLHYVVKAGFVRTIRLLLDLGADANALDEHGRPPREWLSQAAKSVDRDAVRVALESCSDTR
jgi:truncated hemoglobin YjbI/ankyrin repeat protein